MENTHDLNRSNFSGLGWMANRESKIQKTRHTLKVKRVGKESEVMPVLKSEILV